MRRLIFSLILIAAAAPAAQLEAAFSFRDGKLTSSEALSTTSLTEHFNQGVIHMRNQEWKPAVRQFEIVGTSAPHSILGQQSHYNLGVCLFELEEYDVANDAFTDYLQCSNNPQYFRQAVEYKFHIAEAFREGACRRPWGVKQLPKWFPSKDLALEIYDEVIAAVPSSELAACAIYSKAWLQWKKRDFRGSIESFQMMIKRFPKHELAPESYLMITHVYLDQCRTEFQNPDLLAFAEITLRKFAKDFPGDSERLYQAENNVCTIKEIYAQGLYKTGQFYERTKNKPASVIYYQKAMTQFPDTGVAHRCRHKLNKLSPEFLEEYDRALAAEAEKPTT